MFYILKKILFLIGISLFLTTNLKAESNETSFGIDIGYGFLDIGADDTAQTIANLSGSTTTVSYDTGAWFGRFYGDFKIADSTYIDIGLFATGDVSATYTLSGASASESYSASGIDAALVLKEDSKKEGLFVKGGIHSSTVDGNANVTIGGTTYAASATASGIGYVVGGGYDYDDGSRFGITLYSDLGGQSKADMWLFYYGFRF